MAPTRERAIAGLANRMALDRLGAKADAGFEGGDKLERAILPWPWPPSRAS